MPDYHIKRIGAADFPMLIPLMKDCFGMDVNIDYFHWKYIDNPAGHFIGFVAIHPDTEEVGAYYGVIPQRFIIEGKEQVIYQSCDTMTHSKHRRLGLFKLLAFACYDYLEENKDLFVIGFGGNQSTPGFLKFGWKQVFDVKYYFKPSPACLAGHIKRYPDHHFMEIKDAEQLSGLLKKQPAFPGIISGRTVEHIRWRTSNPNYQYRIISYKPGQSAEGYVIYYILNDKLILFDFLFETSQAEKALFWYLYSQVAQHHYKGIIAFCQENGQQSELLRKHYFMSNPFNKGPLSEKTPFIFYAPADILNKYADAASWQITGYDHDAL